MASKYFVFHRRVWIRTYPVVVKLPGIAALAWPGLAPPVACPM